MTLSGGVRSPPWRRVTSYARETRPGRRRTARSRGDWRVAPVVDMVSERTLTGDAACVFPPYLPWSEAGVNPEDTAATLTEERARLVALVKQR
jgi:hypothetical protein